jgi:DNA integrity scanning protein DisA with diadenylate cyclase activity
MYLTLFLFQVGVTVAAVALVVIFQEDIRRAFERIATSRLLGARRERVASVELVDIIVESASTLAQKRVGALIVLRGKEPLERHTSGGFVLDGQPSEPLFYSIFDPSSPGHDGAVILEAGLIRKFGVHLPLSTQTKSSTERKPGVHLGTRHAAALGVTERSDALVVVVSEERGTISMARGGRLDVVDSVAELKQRLLDFSSEISPEGGASLYRTMFTRNLGTKALSLLIAIVAWLVVFGHEAETVARTYDVPVAYRNLPPEWLLEEPDPPSTRVTLSGPPRAFEELDPKTLTAAIALDELRSGSQVVRIADTDLTVPSELSVYRVEPRRIVVIAERAAQRTLSVQAATHGSLRSGLRLARITTKPREVDLVVATADATIREVQTESIDLAEISATVTLTRALHIPKNARLAEGAPAEVAVEVEVTSER